MSIKIKVYVKQRFLNCCWIFKVTVYLLVPYYARIEIIRNACIMFPKALCEKKITIVDRKVFTNSL